MSWIVNNPDWPKGEGEHLVWVDDEEGDRGAVPLSVAGALQRQVEELQGAVDRAHAAMYGSQYVGGPTEREAWQTAYNALSEVVTQQQSESTFDESEPTNG